MNIIFYHPTFDAKPWIDGITKRIPQARMRVWNAADHEPADYALVWRPPHAMLAPRKMLKGIFALGAGVDAILTQEQRQPGTLPAGVPLIRLEDTGMSLQMQEYALASVLRYFRRMDEYQLFQQQKQWRPLAPHSRGEFTVGILGAGVLGSSVAKALVDLQFTVRTWSRSGKSQDGVQSFYGDDQLGAFTTGCKVLINLLPNTPHTAGILNHQLFTNLQHNAYLINLGRGGHLVEGDLLRALDNGQIAAATLDVFAEEPLPGMHPFWSHPRVSITPHVGADTLPEEAMDSIAANILAIEAGREPAGRVCLDRGY
ncbi:MULTISPECIES: glyoxylate/hydroxypyruvate reductase GhrA [Rahnella]|jgi:glyoxylate/hydroxypyruvate reductase A|uniref:glyoxylate/hydroxypyruvate reductase GhrA n=1 Tax=Rahnella TaxID=34037 RepID=UPI001265DF10|nr:MULTISPECIES: glyoxylate/hydroxypyruvate reductase GhrA [Rahnella]KAB8308731.1 glyoxylate/hydroxypyruvate reductase GhrA [Rouxiella chamberiensis]MBU9819980.1 glyoxylate/hydroxypyruvate reductase GhrA [Rahnella sp. BCC 1045]MDF1893621.1 glyoxylate/hydroxypyruvate reductase GhrA [Rahnella contaminans]